MFGLACSGRADPKPRYEHVKDLCPAVINATRRLRDAWSFYMDIPNTARDAHVAHTLRADIGRSPFSPSHSPSTILFAIRVILLPFISSIALV